MVAVDASIPVTYSCCKNYSTRAKVIFTFDDRHNTDLDIVEPILTANNQRAVSFIVTYSSVNASRMLTLDKLKKLQNAGWDISSHTMSHPDLRKLNDSRLSEELNESYDWLVRNGFQKTAGFFAYPFGYYNSMVIEKTKQRYIFARSSEKGIQPNLAQEYNNDNYKIKNHRSPELYNSPINQRCNKLYYS